ncbi:putative hydrolase of the HAD superfamily [Weissella uvarum]|uniref:YjjG family noncanonical pyrimidine nucleotidase n=1 Tax=Weissella uvarum TaxID=1479233 RepID=UPI0019615DB8|nr:YjjG family noncanonical pyrimidine nucleotidase [Weissella uvarum]MBM7617531.1 putative hydrolase of the HAD superfamily [Weissella uvarum]MCM0595585.1 YjjG family noncanonical pyrimidine nucleotidase [Weissella uvarum]
MKYKYLIFDLDDTLFDFKGGEMAGLRQVLHDVGLSGEHLEQAIKTYLKINRGLWAAFENGEIEKATIHQTRFDKLLEVLGISGDGQALERAYRQQLNTNYRLLPGAKELLVELQAAGYHLIAGTNGEAQTQHLRLEHTGLLPYFEGVYISDEMGVAKPNPAFYTRIFADFPDMTHENAVMIGDGLASDIRGGAAAGLDTIWVNLNQNELPETIHPTQVVTDYDELKQAVQ